MMYRRKPEVDYYLSWAAWRRQKIPHQTLLPALASFFFEQNKEQEQRSESSLEFNED